MNSSIRRRIEKLEAVDMRPAKRVVWEDGSGSAEQEIARLDAAGELDGVELYVVRWREDAATSREPSNGHHAFEAQAQAKREQGYGIESVAAACA